MQDSYSFFGFLDTLRSDATLTSFLENNIMRLVLVGLAFGFAVLLIEIRLPLKYYWDLPAFLLKDFFSDFGLGKKPPVWGVCIDAVTHAVIPLSAVELLDKESKETIMVTFSNRLGQYGFFVNPGTYIVRAVKNHYAAPPFYNPENIKLTSTDESFALEVTVIDEVPPVSDLTLQNVSFVNAKSVSSRVWLAVSTFGINLGNGFLAISILGSLYGWMVLRTPIYGILLAVGIVFMFIKVYILEAVGSSTSK